MKIDAFEDDARDAAHLLERARYVGRIGSILTLGLWGNHSAISRAQSLYASAQDDLLTLRMSAAQLAELRARMAEWVEIQGVRVARWSFPDLLLDGRQAYGPEWDSLRTQILERDSYACQHANGSCRGPLQIHHLIWLSQGGTNDPTNLLTLCRFHHGLQHPGNPAFKD